MEAVGNSIIAIEKRIPNPNGPLWLVCNIASQSRMSRISLNYMSSILFGWGLRNNGRHVKYIVCNKGLKACRRELTCHDCWRLTENIMPDRITWDGKDEYVYDYDLDYIVMPTVYAMTEGRIDTEKAKKLKADLTDGAKKVIAWFEKYVSENEIEGAVLFSGLYFPESAIYQVLKRHGIKTYLSEQIAGYGNISLMLNNPGLVPPERQIAITPDVIKWRDNVIPEREKDIVLVLPGVHYDTLRFIDQGIFGNERNWLKEVQSIQAEFPNQQFVINHHPEMKVSGTRNSHSLSKSAKLVLVYASTAGLEAAALGKPVIVGGRAHYSDIVHAPNTIDEWRDTVRQGIDGQLSTNENAGLERLTWFRHVQAWEIWKWFCSREMTHAIRPVNRDILKSKELQMAVDAMLAGKRVEFR